MTSTVYAPVIHHMKQSRMKGEWASLYMETKDGKDMITFKIGRPQAGFSAGPWNPKTQSKRRKTPSCQRRDEKRKAEFVKKKTLETQESFKNVKTVDKINPVEVALVEPKDEILLEEPEVKKVEVEREVNYVGEYVYDSKLQNDDIHKTFWKTLENNFKEGFEEFSNGSTCNEKIIIFWGKCKFKEGFDRSFILNEKNWPKEMKKIEIEEPG